ncbi:MAG TPA: hypothetical protein VNG29_04405 [Candidatus Paceibacterota bacterium]|nr:hypothetical protein [Candidatus Paceibacterota bacterium]
MHPKIAEYHIQMKAIVFISPIVGLPPSLLGSFNALAKRGIIIEGIDIFEGQHVAKSSWKILGLTALPGANARRIAFANAYDEPKFFTVLRERIAALKARGAGEIILGGMSGGFIFAARQIAESPDAAVKGLFGVSPLIFYPPGVFQKSADLEKIPAGMPVVLVWGDGDTIVPAGTVAYAERLAKDRANIRTRVIRGPEAGAKEGKLAHQFFGGKDFVGKMKNVFWNAAAEKIALGEIERLIDSIL